jgi:conjugative transposon protein traQ
MKKKLVNMLWAVGLLTVVSLCLPACDRELEVQQAYDFTLETMPVQKDLRRGETAEIRCSLKRAGRFAGAHYTLRYFQSEGKGVLRLDKGAALKPNDRYPLVSEEFRLYYTSQSADRQTIDVYIEDNFGKMQQLGFTFYLPSGGAKTQATASSSRGQGCNEGLVARGIAEERIKC